jgi:hypothetical protein
MIVVFALFICVTILPNTTPAYEGDGIVESRESSDEELRKAAQNPMADLVSFPVQNNTNFGYRPLDKTQNITNIQPIIPFNLSEDWLLITRAIAPLITEKIVTY